MGRDPYQYFRVEARQILDGLGRGVLQLEKEATPDIIADLLRLTHTLKGAARVVKKPAIAERAHAIEEVLSEVRETSSPLAAEHTNRILPLLDAMAEELAALDAPVADPGTDRKRGPAEEAARMVRGDVAEIDAIVDGMAEASLRLRSVRRALSSVARARHLAELLAEQIGAAGRPASPGLRSVAGELRDLVSTFDRQLVGAVDQAEREMRELRDAGERLRLAPAETLFLALERTARDVAQSLGRETTFEARGGEIRLDAHVLAGVQAALVQLVRNAVAHGIEPAIERTKAGKPATGRVEIEVARRGNRVTFVCRDDGRGVDFDAVLRVAQRRGLLPAGSPRLDAGALLRLLLKGGLTTSGAVTELSGRGIGLDLVRETAARLGGDVRVETEPGRGTTFHLEVPLSLSSLDALLVESDGISAAIPLDAVRRTVRLTQGDVTRTAEGETVMYEGRVLPFIALTRSMGGKAAPIRNGAGRSAVVVADTAALAAIGVDRLLGTANVVVRPLPPLAPADPIVVGALIDAEGTPQLVLDPAELVARAFRVEKAAGPGAETETQAAVLVIDDSLTTRMLEQSILESAGYEVDLATSAEEAMKMAQNRRYDLFLVDVEMPGMDGFTFVSTTRADPALREVPAILVTSRSSPEDRLRGTEAGASGYVVKGDFEQGQLLALIRKVVR